MNFIFPCEQTRLLLGFPSLFLSSQVKHFKQRFQLIVSKHYEYFVSFKPFIKPGFEGISSGPKLKISCRTFYNLSIFPTALSHKASFLQVEFKLNFGLAAHAGFKICPVSDILRYDISYRERFLVIFTDHTTP